MVLSNLHPTKPYQCQEYSGGKVRGVFIGINYTGLSGELRGCVNDVRTMLATLQRIGFPLAEALILVDDPQFPGFSALPTKANIEQALRWLSSDSRPGDTLFLHYSGHGSQQTNRNGTEADGKDETLVPLDYQSTGVIVDDDLYTMVVRPLRPGVRLTAVMDCCHSGTLLDLPFEFVASRENLQTYVHDKNNGFKNTNRNQCDADVMLFSGCADEETSADIVGGDFKTPGNHPGSAGGACTGALSEIFTTTAGLTFVDLLLGLRQSLQRRKFKQLPQLSASRPIDLTKTFSLFGSLAAVPTYSAQAPMVPGALPAPPAGPPPMAGYPPPQQQQYPPQGYPPQSYPSGTQPQAGAPFGLPPGPYPPNAPNAYPYPSAPSCHPASPLPPQSPYNASQYPTSASLPPPSAYPQAGPPSPYNASGGYPQQPPVGQRPSPPPPQQQPGGYPPPQQGPYPPNNSYPPQQGYPPNGAYPPQPAYPTAPAYPGQDPTGGFGISPVPPAGYQQGMPPQSGFGYAPQGVQGGYPTGAPPAYYAPPPAMGGTAAMGSGAQPAWQTGQYANPFSAFGRT
jgi:hypothetical protein